MVDYQRKYSTYGLIFLLLIILLGGFRNFDGTYSTLGGVAASEGIYIFKNYLDI